MIRDQVLSEWITREDQGDIGGGGIGEMLAMLRVNLRYAFPAAAVFDAASTGSRDGAQTGELKAELERRMPDGTALFANWDGRVGLLFSWSACGELESLRRGAESALGRPVHVGVGNPCNRLTDVRHSYSQAISALDHKFYRGADRVIYYRDVLPLRDLHAYPLRQERELAEWLPKADASEIPEAVHRFYSQLLQDGPVAVEHLYETTIRLVAGVEKRVLFDEKGAMAQIRREIVPMLKLETLEEVERYVSGYFADLKDEAARRDREKDSHRQVIQQTIDFMESECRHATLDSVARRVYMTPTYLSMLFRVNTGRTFIEQLTEIRINKAKEMLRNTRLKNYEVAEKVGYRDSRYFSQIFKKKVGLSPSEYRESAIG